MPGSFLVVDKGGSEAPSGVDTGAGDRDGGQVNHEDRESNWERGQNLKFRTKVNANKILPHNKRLF